MRRLNFVKASIIVIIISMLSFYYCDKSDVTSPSGTSGSTSQYLTNTYLQQSKWTVTKLVKNGKDATSHYNGYILHFYNGGTVAIAKNSEPGIDGQWSTDHAVSKNNLNLSFSDTTFTDLNGEWQVTELLTTRISLQAVSRGHTGTDNLVMESINVQQ